MKTPILTNAQEMARQNPETFSAPDTFDLHTLEPGDMVKVCVQFRDGDHLCQGERFWVLLTAVQGDILTGRIDNHLTRSDLHGLKYGDEIKFHVVNVYVIYPKP